jgi:hypothetical protein
MADDAPGRDVIQQVVPPCFAKYDLHQEIVDHKTIEIDGVYARCRTTVETTKVAGPEFRDNRITAVHLLRKVDDEWKMVSSTIEHVEYIN